MFFEEIFDKIFSFVILYKLSKFHYQAVFSSQVIQEMYFLFHALTLDGVTKFKILKYDFKYIAHFLSTSVTFQLLYQTQQFGLVRKPLVSGI